MVISNIGQALNPKGQGALKQGFGDNQRFLAQSRVVAAAGRAAFSTVGWRATVIDAGGKVALVYRSTPMWCLQARGEEYE